MKSLPVLGKVFYTGESSGYIIVTKITKDRVTYSPIFGYEKIMYFSMSRKFFKLHSKYKRFKNSNGLHPKVRARFDHELMRRLNKL